MSRGRRRTDQGAYVDVYGSRTWIVVIAVLILSFMDALLTGWHMIRGSAREVNPVMRAIIDYGGLSAFFTAKAALTVIPMAVIMIHKEWTLGKYAARFCLWSYVCISLYHLYLIFGAQKITGFFIARGM